MLHKDEVCILGYVVSTLIVQIDDERIEAVKTWPKPNSVRDTQVFFGLPIF